MTGLDSVATARWRRWLPPVAVTLALTGVSMSALTSCSQSDDGDGDGDAACPAMVTYAGTEYGQERIGQALEGTEKLGSGVLPGCADTNGKAGPDETVNVWALKGVDRGIAIGVDEGGTLALYVATSVDNVCAVKYTKCE
jgi:hypothetical protein